MKKRRKNKMSTVTKTTVSTVAKQKETKKPGSKSTAKKKAVELGDCITLPSFANNEYETQYSMLVRSQKQTRMVNRMAKFNYICSIVLFALAIAFTVFANWYIRDLGYDIETQTETSKNRFGDKTSYAKYVLKGGYKNESVSRH